MSTPFTDSIEPRDDTVDRSSANGRHDSTSPRERESGIFGRKVTPRIKVVDIDLDREVEAIRRLKGYTAVRGTIWLHETPIGSIELPVIGGEVNATAIRAAIMRDLEWPIVRHLLTDMLATAPSSESYQVSDIVSASHKGSEGDAPRVTVAVCTRDRADDLTLCLDALARLDYPNLDLLVVDNAPTTDATERLVKDTYPAVRYVREPRPGLDWARNRAIVEARGEIVAYTDDDCVPHSGWVRAIVEAFREPGVMAVTGLVVPYELETEPQQLFERYGGFGRGFERRWYTIDTDISARPLMYVGAGQFGTGANMAYRRSIFDEIGGFDPALDVGTVTNGGGDLEMFFRVLKEGHTLLYEPSAVIGHRHRREYDTLHAQLTNNGVGLYSYFVRSAMAYPDERANVARIGLWWFWHWNFRRSLLAMWWPGQLPRELVTGELRGSLTGLRRYQRARRRALMLERDVAMYGTPPAVDTSLKPRRKRAMRPQHPPVAVRKLEINDGLRDLTDVTDYAAVRVFLTRDDRPIGEVTIVNNHQPVTTNRLRHTIAANLGLNILEQDGQAPVASLSAIARAVLDSRGDAEPADRFTPLDPTVPVSVVVATMDRPDDLRKCLRYLQEQNTPRPVEIVVVDNKPSSGLTPPVVAECPGVVLVSEPRQGLSYARNKGFTASTGDIAISTDDDVVMPPDWIERIVAPFAQPSVMVVTGNTLPLELETDAQRRFEEYGGLGRGYQRKDVGRDWFNRPRRRAVPTWSLGATANAAFRSVIFNDPQIGMLDETLGPGTPTGVGEDTYLFYKVLKAGYDIVYEPTAYVWHRHRQDDEALRRQLYNYSKGHVAYHLTTLINDKDLRGLADIFLHLPRWRVKQVTTRAKRSAKGRRTYPLRLIWTETKGNLAGPYTLWKSRQRVKELGRSDPYIPPAQRDQPVPAVPAVATEREAELVAR